MLQRIPIEENIFIEDDFNAYVGTSRSGFENVYEGCDFGNRNETGNTILDFTISYDMILANTWFGKKKILICSLIEAEGMLAIYIFSD